MELSQSQADLATLLQCRPGVRLVPEFIEQVSRFARWMDGSHPHFLSLDAIRDAAYFASLPGWSVAGQCFRSQLQKSKSDVYHAPFQELPFSPYGKGLVYVQHAHDFQPEHLPYLQTKRRLRFKRVEYAGYRRASALLVLGESVKQDAIRFAGLEPDRVFVTPYGPVELPPVSQSFRDKVRETFRLPNSFIFYPAPTRVHKNHTGLIRALAQLKNEGVLIPLVTTGKQQPHFEVVQACIAELGMYNDVIFTDYTDLPTLSALYDMAHGVVLPTLFEGGTGLPLLEAFSKGKPIAAAAVCDIPEAVGSNGALFDPLSESEIVAAVRHLWQNSSNREPPKKETIPGVNRRTWSHFARQCETAYSYALDHPR